MLSDPRGRGVGGEEAIRSKRVCKVRLVCSDARVRRIAVTLFVVVLGSRLQQKLLKECCIASLGLGTACPVVALSSVPVL